MIDNQGRLRIPPSPAKFPVRPLIVQVLFNESLNYLIPIPVLLYFIIATFEFTKDPYFAKMVILTTLVSFIINIAFKLIPGRHLIKGIVLVNNNAYEKESSVRVLKGMSTFPVTESISIVVRWIAGALVVSIPMYFSGRMSLFEFWSLNFLVGIVGIGFVPFNYLRYEHLCDTAAEGFRHFSPDPHQTHRLSLNAKLLSTTLLVISYPMIRMAVIILIAVDGYLSDSYYKPEVILLIGEAIFISLITMFIFLRDMNFRLGSLSERLKDIAEGEGDLTLRLEIKKFDEIGTIEGRFNTFLGKLREIIQHVTKNSGNLNTASENLALSSRNMSDIAGNMSAKSNKVVSFSQETSTKMGVIASSMERLSKNSSMVAVAVEQMTGTVTEITQNSEKARSVTHEAVSQVENASERVEALGQAAEKIGNVTEVITEISQQTNLLALNATIEAARAGESGKGFAVVANEIKELARQTADATGEIKARITDIQDSTSGTVRDIEKISKVISDVNQIVTTIATSVEEQSVTSREIAGSVSSTSSEIIEVNQTLSKASGSSGEIAKNIADVDNEASKISDSSSRLKTSAEELNSLSGQLMEIVEKFKV